MALTDEAIRQIQDMIRRGEFRPGDRLPPEKELSERLGLSRSSMREAVKALEVARVLDVRRGDGTYVTSLDPRLLLESMSFVLELPDDRALFNLFAVRRILEASAAGLAAARITEAQLTSLDSLLAAASATDQVEDLVAHDLEFHRVIVDAADNPYLSALAQMVSGQTVRARVWRGLTQHDAVDRTLAEHRGILDALRNRDAPLAEALTAAHIAGVEHWLRHWNEPQAHPGEPQPAEV